MYKIFIILLLTTSLVNTSFISAGSGASCPLIDQEKLNADFLEKVDEGDISGARRLLRQGAQINTTNTEGLSALHIAAKGLKSNIIVFLIVDGANVNARTLLGMTPLHFATQICNNRIIISILLTHGALVNAQEDFNEMTPLHYAVSVAQDIDVIQLLLTHGARTDLENANGYTAINLAQQNEPISNFLVKTCTERILTKKLLAEGITLSHNPL